MKLIAVLIVAVLCAAGARADDSRALSRSQAHGACASQLAGKLFARTELLFGLSRSSGRNITDAEFQGFVDAEVTPRFPEGLTLLSGDGQFRNASGSTIREGSKLLILLYELDERRSRLVEEVRSAYKRAFEQESVLRTDTQLCVSF
jgi:hypothetical protein